MNAGENLEMLEKDFLEYDGEDTSKLSYMLEIASQIRNAHTKNGNHENAVEIAKKAVQLARENERLEDLSRFNRLIALSYRTIGDFQKAVRYLERALAAAKKKEDFEQLSITYMQLGETYLLFGSSQASRFYSEAEKIAERLTEKDFESSEQKDIGLLALLLGGIGGYYLQKGDIGTASTFFLKMETYVDILDPGGKKVQLLYRLGDFHMDENDYEKAIKRFEECLGIAGNINYKRGIAMSKIGIAKAHGLLGNLEKAEELASEIERIVESETDEFISKEGHYGLGIIYREIGQNDRSLEHLDKSIEYYSKETSELAEARARRERARTLVRKDQIEEAKNEYETSKRMFEDSSATTWSEKIKGEMEKLK